MKRVLTLIAACALCVACSSVESEAIDRLESIDAALKAGNKELAEQLTAEIEEWEQSLNEDDKTRVRKAVMEWTKAYMLTESEK